MKQPEYVITGVNQLTGQREELSRPMGFEEATARLERERLSRKFQRYQPHKRLRVERVQPIQLTFKFEDYE